MRTTVTLDPDVEALIRQVVRERNIGFKQAVNQAVRDGLAKPPMPIPEFRQRIAHLGRAHVDLTKALVLADELDDLDHGYRTR